MYYRNPTGVQLGTKVCVAHPQSSQLRYLEWEFTERFPDGWARLTKVWSLKLHSIYKYTKLKYVALTCINPLPYAKSRNSFLTVVG